MRKAHELNREFSRLTPNFALLNNAIKKNKDEYIRKRLRAIKLLWEGNTKAQVIEKLSIHRTSLQSWIRTMVDLKVEAGIKHLSRKQTQKSCYKLTWNQQSEIIELLESKSPQDFGFPNNTFTGEIVVRIIEKKYQIKVSDQLVYNMLHRHGFSYQKAHRDYENADPEKQKEFCEAFKKNWIQNQKPK